MTGCVALLTVGEASNPSKSGNGNMRHIPIHAEDGGGGRVDAQDAQCLCSPTRLHISLLLQERKKHIQLKS